jgi:putative DNA primase/helicase
MLRGRGSNGKTKLIQTMEHLINKRAIYSDRMANIESDKFAIGALAGKLLLLDDDVDTDTLLPDGFLKKVSERKVLTGQLKFKDAFEFVATCLPVMLANNYPRCADLSWGQRRRAKLIPFDRIFTQEDKDDTLFPSIWAHEMPGVLNRAIEGLQRLRQRGGFAEPADCRKALAEWLAHANPLAGFIEERGRPDLTARMPTSAFYRAFRQWADEAGIRNIPARNTIKRNLENLGYRVDHGNAGSTVFGIDIEPWYAARDAA